MDKSIVEFTGWLGVICYVFAYLLLSIGKLKSDSYWFHSLNILGAIGLITDAAYYVDMPNLVVNVVWLLIGFFTISRRVFRSSVNK